MATVAQRAAAASEAAREARKAAAQDLLHEIKLVFDDRPAVYQEIVKNLNSLWKVDDTDGCFARVEALLATARRPHLLAQFRDFMPQSAVAAWQQSAPEPADPGKGEGSAREPITFESDDEAAAPAPAAAGEDDSDDDVVLVSTTLTNPLVDLPHARHECAALGMPARDDAAGRALARRFCARCYCTLCDRPVSDCAAWPEHARYRDEPRWRAVRDALTAVPEPPPRRFKRPRLRGAPAAAPAAQTRPVARRARTVHELRRTASRRRAPNSVDDATVAARARELLANDGEIKREFDNGSLTVETLRTAVATTLGVDEEAIKNVVKATLADYRLGPLPRLPPAPPAALVTSTAPLDVAVPSMRTEDTAVTREAAARATRRRVFWAGAENAAPPPAPQDDAPPPAAPDDGSDSDVGAYFELSSDND